MASLSRLLVPLLVSFLAGVFVASYLWASFYFAVFFILCALSFLIISLLHSSRFPYVISAVICIGLAFGVVRIVSFENNQNYSLQKYLGEHVHIKGIVIDEPNRRGASVQLTLSVNLIEHNGQSVSVADTVVARVDPFPEYAYGDVVFANGILTLPRRIENDDRRVFDYPNYLRAKGIHFELSHPSLVLDSRGAGDPLRRFLYKLKRSFVERMNLSLPEPEGALASGLLLGNKQDLGDEWTERFRNVGIIHIVVLSGYNMTIVAEWLGAAFLFLGFYASIACATLGIILFTLMVGGGATVVRAAIMAILVLLARITGRTYDFGRALLVAGALMVAHNPLILAHDPSFQLSFLASLGLVFVSPVILSRLKWMRFSFLREIVVSTLATQILVLPLLLYQTGILSLVALPANILVLPSIPFAMFLSFLSGVLAYISTALAFVPSLFAHLFLLWPLLVAQYGARIPFASVHLPLFSGAVVCVVYIIFTLGLFLYYRKKNSLSILPRNSSDDFGLVHIAVKNSHDNKGDDKKNNSI